jgi:endoglucanase
MTNSNGFLKLLSLISFVFIVSPAFAAKISDNIRLNSIGFMPEMVKQASVAAKCMEFTVKSAADNKVVFKGKASGPFDSADTKETVYIIDFTSVKEPGTYYIEAQSVGRSYNFKIAENVYDSAFYTVMRGMYLWRCGTAVHTTYNGVTFSP